MDVRPSLLTPALLTPSGALAAAMALCRTALARFLAVGLIGLATDAGVFTLLHDMDVSRLVARAGSLAVATAVTWTLNRAFTFASTGRRRRAEIVRYALVVIIAQGVSYSIFASISWAWPQGSPLIALFVGAAIATAFSFTGQRYFTFRARARDI